MKIVLDITQRWVYQSTEQGRTLEARVKGKTESALLRLPFKAVYIFRPAGIQPLHGIQSRTPAIAFSTHSPSPSDRY